MKRIFTILLAVAAFSFAQAQTTIFDGFEDYPDFTINPPGTWTFLDLDESGTYGFTGIDFTNSLSPMAGIVFNPNTCDPALEGADAYAGDKYLAMFAAVDGPNNDWMISPELTGGMAYKIDFWAKSFTINYGAERLKVGYSTTTNDPGAFTFVQGGAYMELPEEWTNYTYDFPAGTKFIALVCVSDDAFITFIDNVAIDPVGGSGVVEVEKNHVSIYPNPVQEVLNVSATGFDKVEIVNFLGQVIYQNQVTNNNFQINTADFSDGVYFVRLIGENTVTKKFIKK